MIPARDNRRAQRTHEDRTHLGLGKGTPNNRSRAMASVPSSLRNDSAGCTIATIELLENQEAGFEPRRELQSFIYGLFAPRVGSRR